MKKVTLNKWIGSRVLKTGLAAFLTAWVCDLFDWPALFAVITAIVTIEPTAADSIKKGLVRFPAATIGAAFAMLFESIFGATALAYALAATLTLTVCHKLRLDAGMLVATLTAVAMIAETENHFETAFVVRLSTTLVGLVVSTIINIAILPPPYMDMVRGKVDDLYEKAGDILKRFVDGSNPRQLQLEYKLLNKELERAFSLAQFQRAEWKYRRHSLNELRQLRVLIKKLDYLQKILYHFGNLLDRDIKQTKLTVDNVETVSRAAESIALVLKDPDHNRDDEHDALIRKLDDLFSHEKAQQNRSDAIHSQLHITKRLSIIYELLALEDTLRELQYICTKEEKGKLDETTLADADRP